MQDATVQSTQPTSQVQPAVAPNSYVAAAPAPQAAPAPGPVPYQVGTSYPQAVAPTVPNYQSPPSQYAPQYQQASPPQAEPAPAPQGNPWESAFNKVVGLLSQPAPSPFQGQPYQPTTQYTPANYGTTNSPVTYPSAPQTWQPSQESYSSSSQTSSQVLTGQAAQEAHAEVNNAIADYYHLSDESRNVINAYGVEAPAILNQYALNLEGMLDSAVQWGHRAQDLIQGYANHAVHANQLLQGYANFAVNEHQENLAYNEILTNPDTLSDYTLKFFGPEGPCPVYQSEAELETPGYRTNAMAQVGQAPQMPVPPQAAPQQNPTNFWGQFTQQMDADPQNAWRLLNQAQPQVVANKLFVAE